MIRAHRLLGASAALLLLLCGCSRKHREQDSRPEASASATVAQAESPAASRLPGQRRELEVRTRPIFAGAIADLDGDGKPELVLVDASHIRVLDASGNPRAQAPVAGGIQTLVAVDLDGDGRTELVAGWGRSHEHQGATSRITVHRWQQDGLQQELLTAPSSSRHQVTAIVPLGGGELHLAYFESKYMVKSVRARPEAGGWAFDDVAVLRMAGSYAYGDVDGDGKPDLVVGRIYGDESVDGDAFLLRLDGARVEIPTTRGVRGLAVVDSDGDGAAEVFVGDGWHASYGKHARALLTRARWVDGRFQSEPIHDAAGEYTVWDILPADLDGDGSVALVTRTSHAVRVHRHRPEEGWQQLTVARADRDSDIRHIAVGNLDGKKGDEILIVGERAEIVSLRGVSWSQ